MFLKHVKSKGNVYIYLCSYNKEDQDKITVYSFGRIDKALREIRYWKSNSLAIPNDLKMLGCNKEDLDKWIKQIETRQIKFKSQLKSII